MKKIFTFTILLLALSYCAAPQTQAGLPNPASVYCEQNGNKLEIVTAADDSQSGRCVFPDGNACDEWAYYRGECGPASQTSSTPAMTVEATTEEQALGGYMPPGATEEIADWWGVIKSVEPGSQSDDYFERQDLGQIIYFGIDSMDPAVKSQIESLRDSGKIIHLCGTLVSNVPDYSGSQILVKRIDEIYTKYPFYGSRRMTATLCREGLTISRPTVQQYMREMDIAGIAPGPNTSQPHLAHKTYPYLLRSLKIERPNEVWGIDITYIRHRAGWMYLVAVLDWFSRFVVVLQLDQTLEMLFVLQAVDQALDFGHPEIWNSDQGSHFTGPQYVQKLLEVHIQVSMDGRGRARDNIFTKRLWRSVKCEEVYLHDYDSPREARHGLGLYFDFYNFERLHQAIDYRTPEEVHFKSIILE